jgi:hypothetical protein
MEYNDDMTMRYLMRLDSCVQLGVILEGVQPVATLSAHLTPERCRLLHRAGTFFQPMLTFLVLL